jgi:hypothetical protein
MFFEIQMNPEFIIQISDFHSRSPVVTPRSSLLRLLYIPAQEFFVSSVVPHIQGSPVGTELFNGKVRLCMEFKELQRPVKTFCF